MGDNRYTGVGYEPPFETPSDKDFMSAHIESLEAEIAALRNQLSAEQTSVNELSLANQELHKRQRVLVETLENLLSQLDVWVNAEYCLVLKLSITKARAALAAKEV